MLTAKEAAELSLKTPRMVSRMEQIWLDHIEPKIYMAAIAGGKWTRMFRPYWQCWENGTPTPVMGSDEWKQAAEFGQTLGYTVETVDSEQMIIRW